MKKYTFFTIYTFLTIFFFSSGIAHAEDLSKNRELYLTKCAKCHKLYNPSGYDDAAWCQWMEKMRKKSHLDSEQYDLLVRYCNSLRKGAPTAHPSKEN